MSRAAERSGAFFIVFVVWQYDNFPEKPEKQTALSRQYDHGTENARKRRRL